MPLVWFIFSIVCLLAGGFSLWLGLMRPRTGGTIATGVVGLLVGLVVLFLSVVTIIPTRNIAVSMAFGRPTGTLGNGWHWIAPWESTEVYDASIQTLKLSGDQGDAPGIVVRLANAATARVDVTVQWQIDPDADITQLHLDYKNFTNIQDNVVKRQLAAALNAVFEGYDPLVALKRGQEGTGQVTLAQLSEKVHAELTRVLPKGLLTRSVTIPLIRLDGKVQEALDKYQQTLAETQIAEQRRKTAEALKAANDILASANNTPGALYQNCLDLTERLAQQGKVLPAAWSCNTIGSPVTVVPVK